MPSRADDVIGLIPAAGAGRRLGSLPVSKEILPIGFRETAGGPMPAVLCEGLLDAFRAAGIRRAFLITTAAKLDIPRHLSNAAEPGLSLAYLCIPGSSSVPETLDHAYPFTDSATVALGFPDVLFHPADAFAELLHRHRTGGADVVLGLFPAGAPHRTDMVELGAHGEVRSIHVRPGSSSLRYNWLLAVWSSRFGRFLHRAVQRPRGGGEGELQLGEILGAALDSGLSIAGVPFADGRYVDAGTPEDVAALWADPSPTAKGQC